MISEIIIIGGGPSGLSCASYLNRLGRNCTVIYKTFGGKLNYYSRIKGFYPFEDISTIEFIKKQKQKISTQSNNKVQTSLENNEVIKVEFTKDSLFRIECVDQKCFYSRVLVVATGTEPYVPGIIQNSTLKYYTFKNYPFNFIKGNDKILILGVGNTAIDVLRSIEDKFGEVLLLDINSEKYNDLIEEKKQFLKKFENCKVVFDSNYELSQDCIKYSSKGLIVQYLFDHLILCTGEESNTGFLPQSILNRFNGRISLVKDNNEGRINMSESFQGLFAIGDTKDDLLTSNVSYAIADGMRTAISVNNYLNLTNGTTQK